MKKFTIKNCGPYSCFTIFHSITVYKNLKNFDDLKKIAYSLYFRLIYKANV